jgi:hypothetical protein
MAALPPLPFNISEVVEQLGELFQNDIVEVTAKIHLRAALRVPKFLGGHLELVELRLEGFTDDNDNLLPEFTVDLEFFNRDVFPPTKVELNPSTLFAAMGGSVKSIESVFGAVFEAVQKAGHNLPALKVPSLGGR